MFHVQKGLQDVKILRQGISWVANPWRTSEALEDKMDKGHNPYSMFNAQKGDQDVKILVQRISFVAEELEATLCQCFHFLLKPKENWIFLASHLTNKRNISS